MKKLKDVIVDKFLLKEIREKSKGEVTGDSPVLLSLFPDLKGYPTYDSKIEQIILVLAESQSVWVHRFVVVSIVQEARVVSVLAKIDKLLPYFAEEIERLEERLDKLSNFLNNVTYLESL